MLASSIVDCENRLARRRQRERGPRGPARVLLSRAGLEGPGLLPDFAAF